MWQGHVMPLRFRPFGVGGSVLEVLGGLIILRSALWTDEEEYPGWFAVVVVAIGTLLICTGVTGIVAAARRALMARNNRSRDSNAA
jgi:hypothetical protein